MNLSPRNIEEAAWDLEYAIRDYMFFIDKGEFRSYKNQEYRKQKVKRALAELKRQLKEREEYIKELFKKDLYEL